MPHITTCPACGACYEECSEEWANDPLRLCPACHSALVNGEPEPIAPGAACLTPGRRRASPAPS
jgi:hypothetical protein